MYKKPEVKVDKKQDVSVVQTCTCSGCTTHLLN